MNIKNIKLSNYRNFKDYELKFGKQATIFIGKNGMGKTNLITALKQSLSFIFSKNKGEMQYDFIASSEQKIESFSATDPRYCNEGESGANYKYPISIKVDAEILNNAIKWEFLKESATSGLSDSYKYATVSFWSNYTKKMKGLPVLAYFSDSYPHIKTTLGKNMKAMLDSGNELPRNSAYYKWDNETNCTEIWIQYFVMQQKSYLYNAKKKKSKAYTDAITEKLVVFSKPISKILNNPDMEIETLILEPRGKNDILVVVFKNGDHIPFDQLPQGYKRMFSIVFDIASRSYILNGNCDSSGIVMIDEIELHLHPSIAQEILQRLMLTFENIQFIASTHSPLVITNFKQDTNNRIYNLYKEEGVYMNERVDDLYGVDYNSGLKYSMGAPARDSAITELLKSYAYWKNAKNAKMIERFKNMIKEAVGEDNKIYTELS